MTRRRGIDMGALREAASVPPPANGDSPARRLPENMLPPATPPQAQYPHTTPNVSKLQQPQQGES